MPSSESSGITVDDLTIGEVESSTAIVFTNRRMQQQQQQPLPFGSEFSIFQPELSSRSLIKANVEGPARRPGSFVECFMAFVACFEFHNI
uniref:Uncharacterized protein n=1 Tax=Solanum tuberosum TaxID=4113 RepID=M1DAT2_SOLTU